MHKTLNLLAAGLFELSPCGSSPTDLIIVTAVVVIALVLLVLGILFHLGVSDFQEYED